MKDKPKVGQILYSLNVGNAVSKYRPQKLTEVVVKKVGRKYFYCGDERYYIDGWKQDSGQYIPTSCLYENVKDWEDEKEYSELCDYLRNFFTGQVNKYVISLQSLRHIRRIIEYEKIRWKPSSTITNVLHDKDKI